MKLIKQNHPVHCNLCEKHCIIGKLNPTMPRNTNPKMVRKLITIRPDQVAQIKGNLSGYIQKLIDNDRTQVVKLNYAGQLIADYMNNHDAIDLATLFAKRLAGIDVLAELMEGGGNG